MSAILPNAGVPGKIWDMLNVDPQQRMAEVWSGWSLHARQHLLRMARSEADPTTPWRTLPDADRTKVMEVLSRCRSLYIACDLSTNWRHVVNAMNVVGEK